MFHTRTRNACSSIAPVNLLKVLQQQGRARAGGHVIPGCSFMTHRIPTGMYNITGYIAGTKSDYRM